MKAKSNNKKEKTMVSDTVFKYFIKSEEYRDWYYEIIKEKCHIDLNEYSLYDNESNTGNVVKDYRMDTVFRGSRHTVIVEMNSEYSKESEIKMYFYLHRIQGSQVEEGKEYRPYKTTLIAFNNYRNPKTPNLAIGYYKMTEQTTKVTKEEDIESYEISLPNFHEKEYNEVTSEIDKRLWLIGVKDMEEIKPLNLSEENKKIIREYERLVEEDARFGLVYDVEKDQKMLLRSAHSYGYEEGVEKANIETAKKMLLKNKSIEEIQEFTELTLEEIEKIKSESILKEEK